MSELRSSCLSLFHETEVARALARRYDLPGPAAVVEVTDRTVPIITDALARRVAERDESDELVTLVTGIDQEHLVDPAATFRGGDHETTGSRLVRILMNDRATRRSLALESSDELGDRASGPGLLAAVAWSAAAQLRRRTGRAEVVDRVDDRVVDTGDRAPTPDIGGAVVVSAAGDHGSTAEAEDRADRGPSIGPGAGDALDLVAGLADGRTGGHTGERSESTNGHGANGVGDQATPVGGDRAGDARFDASFDAWAAASDHLDDGEAELASLPAWSRQPTSDRPGTRVGTGDRSRARGARRGRDLDTDVQVGSSRLVTGLAVLLIVLVLATAVVWVLERQGYLGTEWFAAATTTAATAATVAIG